MPFGCRQRPPGHAFARGAWRRAAPPEARP